MTPTQKDTEKEMEKETVYYGDCLEHLTQWCNWNASHPFARILSDLFYLDPPYGIRFNSNYVTISK